MTYTQKAFWLSAIDRAIRTIAQTALAALGGENLGFFSLDWSQIGSLALLAGLASILTSLATPTTVAGTYTPRHAAPKSD